MRQQTFVNNVNTLYLISTPIGNLEDITFRAINTLKMVDVLFCEDTRQTLKLLNHYDIKKKVISYHEHNKEQKEDIVIEYLKNGNVGLVSDAGMPVINDPGYDVAKRAIQEGFNVTVIPGANAALSALISSGLPADRFTYIGFLSNKKSQRVKELEEIKLKKESLIFYESPHRIKDTLKDMLEVFGDRQICLAREITKKFEEFIRGAISEILQIEEELKGEMVIVVEGAKEVIEIPQTTIKEQFSIYVNQGLSDMDAIKKIAKERGLKKQDVYKEIKID